MESLINNRYDIIQNIGSGSFGQIYTAVDLKTGDEVAVKIELCKERSLQLCNEAKIYRILDGAIGIPSIKDFIAKDGTYTALIIDLLGDSVESLFQKSNRTFSLKTVLMLAEQMISRIQLIHSKGIVHNDIKPSNFVMGTYNNSSIVHLIDFGLAGKFRGFYNNKHIEYADGQKFFGTPEFASLNAHRGIQKSRRDDLESLAYILIYFLKGTLPWLGLNKNKGSTPDNHTNQNQCLNKKNDQNELKENSNSEITKQIFKIKENTPIEELCLGLPEEFSNFLSHVRKLEFNEEPDYSFYKKMFRELFMKQEFQFDNIFEWTCQLPNLYTEKALKKKQQNENRNHKRPTCFFTSSLPIMNKIKRKDFRALRKCKAQGINISVSHSRVYTFNCLKEC